MRVFSEICYCLHKSHMAGNPRKVPYVPLPSGIPTHRYKYGLFVWPPELSQRLLVHDDFDLLWVVGGRVALQLSDGTRLEAGNKQMLMLPPFVAATISQTQSTARFWFCHFDFRGGNDRAATELSVPLKISGGRAIVLGRAYRALNRITPDAAHADWQRESALIELVRTLADTCGQRASPAQNQLRLPHDPRVLALWRKIDTNPCAPWRVTDLADSAGMSAGHLHALWHRVLGCSVKSYLVRARLKFAAGLLSAHTPGDPRSIKEVAAACGFSSQHLFARQFHKAFGLTPTAFRDSAGF